jgi:hypothetical protein
LRYRRTLGLLFLSVILVAVFNVPSLVWAQQNNSPKSNSYLLSALITLIAAQSQIVQCYEVSNAAESAGANISQLTLKLNAAGLLLSDAQLAYSNHNFELAANLARQSQNELAGLISEANALQSAASHSQTFDFLLNVVGSILGTIAVIAGSFAVWFFLKRKYGHNGAQKSESDAV